MAHLLFLLAPFANLHGSLKQQITTLKSTSPLLVLKLELLSYFLLTILAILVILYNFPNNMDRNDDEIAHEEFILEMRLQTLERRIREVRERRWEEGFYTRAILGVQ
jgi:hypothetical protein